MMRRIAPAGAPIGMVDVGRWVADLATRSDAEVRLSAAICARLGRRHCAVTSTGRAGLTLLLSALASLRETDRTEVILPSYTCYSVAASIVRAGLRPRVVDLDPQYLDFDLEQLRATDCRRVLAIVATSLYGLPARLPQLATIAREAGVFLIDDSAQALGATVGGRPCGGWGDVGLLSFDKGKNISAIDGGAIVTDSDAIARAVKERVRQLPTPSFATRVEQVVKLGAYVAFLSPSLYWIPSSVPGLGLGRTVYDDRFVIERDSTLLAALALTMLPRLSAYHAHRVATARAYERELSDVANVRPVACVPDAQPDYLRYPLLARDSALRDAIVARCVARGLGATCSYPRSIVDVPELQDRLAGPTSAPIGRDVAQRIITLPTHPFVTADDVATAGTLIAGVAAGARDGALSGALAS